MYCLCFVYRSGFEMCVCNFKRSMLVHMCKYVCFVCVYSSQQWEPLLTDPLTLRPVSPHCQQCAQLLNENKPANLINCEKHPLPPHVHTHTLKVISSQFFFPVYMYIHGSKFIISFFKALTSH